MLDVLGAHEVIEAHGFVRKTRAFYGWGGQEWSLGFDQPHRPAAYSFQVIRSQFDQMLLEHARTQGADVRVREEVRAGRITFEDGSDNGQDQRAVEATWTGQNGTEGRIRFGHLVDASGRAGLLAARQLRTRRVHDVFRNVATWSYWHGAAPLAAAPSGAIGLFSLPDHGWLWAIPLHNGTLSVGLVIDKRSLAHARQTADGSLQTVYDDAIARCPRLAGMVTDARQTAPLKTESDYSYVSDTFTGPGWFLAGDAACSSTPCCPRAYTWPCTAACSPPPPSTACCAATSTKPPPAPFTRPPTSTPTNGSSSWSAPSTASTTAATTTSAPPSSSAAATKNPYGYLAVPSAAAGGMPSWSPCLFSSPSVEPAEMIRTHYDNEPMLRLADEIHFDTELS